MPVKHVNVVDGKTVILPDNESRSESTRMTPERKAEIYGRIDGNLYMVRPWAALAPQDLAELRVELDAVTKERVAAVQAVRDLTEALAVAKGADQTRAAKNPQTVAELSAGIASTLPTLENVRAAHGGKAPWDCPECGEGSPNHKLGCPRVKAW
jgi:hypothetical protein